MATSAEGALADWDAQLRALNASIAAAEQRVNATVLELQAAKAAGDGDEVVRLGKREVGLRTEQCELLAQKTTLLQQRTQPPAPGGAGAAATASAAAADLAALRVTIDEAPSSFALPATWSRYQFPRHGGEPAFACFRPFVGPPRALPASLVARAFGSFLDTAHACGADADALGRCDKESECLARLLQFMPLHHKQEVSLQTQFNAALSTLLGRAVDVFLPSEGTSRSCTDGGVFVEARGRRALVLVVEVKRDGNGSDPSFQMQRELQMHHSELERQRSPLLARDACPAFLVEVVGPLLRVSAAASLVANRVQAEPLTPFMHVLHVRDQPAYVARLLAVLRALRTGVEELAEHYRARLADVEAADSASPAADDRADAPARQWVRDPALLLPYPLRDGGRFSGAEHMFKDRLLYLATTAADGRVCVKFSRHEYGAEVHRAWAAAGLAPRLLSLERLSGGLTMVVMEALLPDAGWLLLAQLPAGEGRAGAVDAALAALARAHALRLPDGAAAAHGDCRAVNVLVRRSADAAAGNWDVRFVDFDGAGADGGRLYPPLMSAAIEWPIGAVSGLPLRQEHDRALLQAARGR